MHLGNCIIFPFCISQNRAFRLCILKQYFVPILLCCWKILRKYALTFNSSLNKRVMDFCTGGKVSIWQLSNNWWPQMRCKNDWQHTLDYPLAVHVPHCSTDTLGEICSATACAVPVWGQKRPQSQWRQAGTLHEHYIHFKGKRKVKLKRN